MDIISHFNKFVEENFYIFFKVSLIKVIFGIKRVTLITILAL